MNNIATIRKVYFCFWWVFWFVVEMIFRKDSVLEDVAHSAWAALMLPGWIAYLLLGSLRHVSADDYQTAPLSFVIAALFWFFPVARLRRMFGTHDPFIGSDKPRPRIAGAAVWLAEQINSRLFGRQRTGGWDFLGMFASAFRNGDYLVGRAALFGGRLGTLWPIGVPATGCAVSIGMPGSGKSTAAAIMAVLKHIGALLCLDPKGEIARRCYEARKSRGDATFVVDPVGLTGLPPSCFNPLYEIEREPNPDNAARMMFNLAESLPNRLGGENSWVDSGSRDAAIFFIGYVLITFPPEERNLATVRRLLMQGDRAAYAAAVADKVPGIEKLTPFEVMLRRAQVLPPHPFRDSVAGQAANLEKLGDRQRGVILSALADATIWLDLVQFQEATSRSDFRLRDFSTAQMSVFVSLPLNELTGIAGGFMRMFLVMFTDMMYRAPKPPKKPVLCLVDELPAFGYISRLCAIGPTMRSYGVKLWVLLQDLGQLKAIYPKEWESFLGCAAMVQWMSIQHGESVDYLVKSLGEKIIRQHDPVTGRVVKTTYPLLDRQQVPIFLSARSGNAIIIRYNRKPLRLKVTPYHWFLPFSAYAPDPLYPEPRLRAWMRRRAESKAAEAKAAERRAKQGTAGEEARHAAGA